MSAVPDDVLEDLAAEYDRLESILGGLTPVQWSSPSGAPGWTVRDVVVHLAQSEEGVPRTIGVRADGWTTRRGTLDDAINAEVRADDMDADAVLARWAAARRASVDALRTADPDVSVRWAAAPLKPRTLATTRLAEHWAHALDVCDPLDIDLPDTDRLRHIAWLGHATLPYALRLAGIDPFPVRCVLELPSGAPLVLGPDDAAAGVSGSVGAFCRVGARRVAGDDSGLTVSGPDAAAALRVMRNYAA